MLANLSFSPEIPVSLGAIPAPLGFERPFVLDNDQKQYQLQTKRGIPYLCAGVVKHHVHHQFYSSFMNLFT